MSNFTIPVVAALAAGLLASVAHGEGQCVMTKVAELTVTQSGTSEVVAAEVDGHPVSLVLDTGSMQTLLFQQAAAQLGLKPRQIEGATFYGVGGKSGAFITRLATFKLGSETARNFDILVTGEQKSNFQGLMGTDILLRSDVEFDLGAGKVRFFKPDHCEGAQVIYWSKPASVLPMTAFKPNRIEVQVRVGSTPVTAFMDTGADISTITPAAAALAGITPNSKGVSNDEPSVGIGPKQVPTLVAVFPSFSFGDETIRNAKLRIADPAVSHRLSPDAAWRRFLSVTPRLCV